MSRVPVKDRFQCKYKIDSKTGCWNWISAIAEGRYGVIWIADGKSEYAHRVSYRLHNGPIPRGRYIAHHCDNPRCVRPDHLYAATPKQNLDDMWRRGRGPNFKGENNPGAKLTAVKVRQIRELLAADHLSQEAIGARFGVCRGTVKDIKRGKLWAHVQ